MKWLINFLKGTWLGHPLHPILVHVPMAMWPGALIFDLLSRWNGNVMVRLSFYAIIFGLVASLLAVPTGVVDWSGIKKEDRRRDCPARRIILLHIFRGEALGKVKISFETEDCADLKLAHLPTRSPRALAAFASISPIPLARFTDENPEDFADGAT
jgi:hypothetical protein